MQAKSNWIRAIGIGLSFVFGPLSLLLPAKGSNTVASDAANSPADHKSSIKDPRTKQDLPNFHEVHPFLYRGGEPTEAGLRKLKEIGVATIIDLRAHSEQEIEEAQLAPKLGLHYINLVMDAHAPTTEQVNTLLNTIDEAKKKTEAGEKNAAVFVHCAHGSDRTGCMIGIWRVKRDNFDYPTTYQEMRKYYFTPKFTELSGSVERYAKQEKH